MRRSFVKIIVVGFALMTMAVACNKDEANDSSDSGSGSKNTGSITVYNKYPSSNAHNIYSIRIYNSGFDKWDFTDIYRNKSHTISDIPAGTYTVQAEYVLGTYTKKTGVKVKKGKTTDVVFP